MRKGKHPVYMGGAVYQDGKPIGLELVEENYFASQNDHTRYSSILTRYDNKSGVMNEIYLDYKQTRKIQSLMRALDANGSSLGGLVDWMAQQAVIRPTLNQNANALANYTLQSFFVDVSQRELAAGQDPFNFMVAESIQILSELITDCVAMKIVNADDPEKVIRQGFEEVAKARLGGVNIRNLDQFFDDVQGAIENAIQSGQGRFAGMTSAAGATYKEVGKYLAREIKKDPAFMRRLNDEPSPELTLETYEFLQKRLAKMGIQMEEPPEVKFAKQLIAANNRIVQYEKTTAGGELAEKEKPLQETRNAGSWWQRLISSAGRG